MAHLENSPRDLKWFHVIFRFCVRIMILTAFAAFGTVGFVRSLAALAAMSTLLCAVLATAKRETFFGAELNYWDEAIAYAALYCLIGGIDLLAGLRPRPYIALMRSAFPRTRIHIRRE
jgi:hypothetical protein